MDINKIGHIIANALLNEAFDFDNEVDDAPDSIDMSSVLCIPILKMMYKNKINPKYVLQNIYQTDLSKYNQLFTIDNIKNIKSLDDRLGYISYNNLTLNQPDIIPNTLLANSWTKTTYKNIGNDNIKFVIDMLIEHVFIEKGGEYYVNDDEKKTALKQACKDYALVCISPDKGMIYICYDDVNSGKNYSSYARHYTTTTGYFIFTGLVNYLKIKSISLNEIDLKTKKWFKKLLNNYGCSYTPKNHFNLIYDKNGYPRIYAIISQQNLWKVLPNAAYKSIMQNGWTADLKTNNDFQKNILRRRDTTDGVLLFGLFYPWDIRAFVKSTNFYTYSSQTAYDQYNRSYTLDNLKDMSFGLAVYQLGEEGKKLYDEFKTNLK